MPSIVIPNYYLPKKYFAHSLTSQVAINNFRFQVVPGYSPRFNIDGKSITGDFLLKTMAVCYGIQHPRQQNYISDTILKVYDHFLSVRATTIKQIEMLFPKVVSGRILNLILHFIPLPFSTTPLPLGHVIFFRPNFPIVSLDVIHWGRW